MELTDLTKEQRQELNPILLEMIVTGKTEQEIFDFILEKHPKLVYMTMDKVVAYSEACLEDTRKELEERRRYLIALEEYYEMQKQIISEKFNLTLDEVEEINERFKFKRWTTYPPIFRLIVLAWKAKRIFRGARL